MNEGGINIEMAGFDVVPLKNEVEEIFKKGKRGSIGE